MPHINDNFLKLKAGYLFPEIARRVAKFAKENPQADIIKLGIGDVTEPLPKAITQAMRSAIDEMETHQGFHGYGPEQGYLWLRQDIAKHDFQARGCDISADEIFVSDGAKCDTGNFLDILGKNNVIAVGDPVYPVYVDTNVMAGNTSDCQADDDADQYPGLVYLSATEANHFSPPIPSQKVDIVYLCYPNNPTGTVATKETLTQWVNYAKANDTLILFDAAYEAFITEDDIPHSIYEIPGATDVAVEFRSFSKNAGFTGTRCAFTVVPKTVFGKDKEGNKVPLHQLWNRRQCTKYNGVPYIIQRGAQAVYSEEGQKQTQGLVAFYLENAKLIRQALIKLGFDVFGGINAPYVWLKTKDGLSSWDFFDKLMRECHLIGTPGSGFGKAGQGYFRISAFNSRQNIEQAIQRLNKAFA